MRSSSDCEKKSFVINFWSYLIGSFQNFMEQILTHSLLKVIEIGVKQMTKDERLNE